MRIECENELIGLASENEFSLCDARDAIKLLLPLHENKVQLIYLDPPFLTGDNFVKKAQLDQSSRSFFNVPAYSDCQNKTDYYEMMREIIIGCHSLLCEEGSLYLHIDYRAGAMLKILLDDIFGENNFVNEIIWHYKSGGRATSHFSRKHDTIYFYRKSKNFYFDITSVGILRGKESHNHMKRNVDNSGKVSFSIKSGGKTYTYDEDTLVYPGDVWDDISHLHQKDPERTGFETQKPEALLRRIILSSSRAGDTVCDFFSGSGTTAVVARQTGRKFFVSDSSPIALHTLRKRMISKQSTLFDLARPGLTLHYGKKLQPLDARIEFSQHCGHIEATLLTCSPPDSQSLIQRPLDIIDYWSIGELENNTYKPFAHAYRETTSHKLSTTLSAPASSYIAAQVVDVFGRQSFYTAKPIR